MTSPDPPLTLIGYWLGWLSDDDFLAPQEVMFQLPSELRERVAAYLEGGVVVRQYRGSSWCRFYCGLDHNGSCELSDGEWVWPSGLAHYVREHGVRLPAPFIERALEGKPVSADACFKREISDTYWKSWGRENTNPEFRTQLALERSIADKWAAADVEAHIASKERETGISNNQCAMAGCIANALVGIAFCANHWLDDDTRQGLGLPHYRARFLLKRWSR